MINNNNKGGIDGNSKHDDAFDRLLDLHRNNVRPIKPPALSLKRRCEWCKSDKGYYNPLRYCGDCCAVIDALERIK